MQIYWLAEEYIKWAVAIDLAYVAALLCLFVGFIAYVKYAYTKDHKDEIS